jgi:hypothetical protein
MVIKLNSFHDQGVVLHDDLHDFCLPCGHNSFIWYICIIRMNTSINLHEYVRAYYIVIFHSSNNH